MANFLKIIDLPDCEVIIDVDKILWIERLPSSYKICFGGEGITISAEAYEKIKERMLNPFGRPRKT